MRFVPRAPHDDENVNTSKAHPVRETVVLATGLLVVGSLVLTVLTFATDVVTGWIPPSVEVATFGSALVDDEGGFDDPRAPALDELVQALAALDPELGYPRLKVGVLPDAGPNAFAMLGGGLFVTRGLLDDLESENELAFVIAHELGHFAHRDQLRGLSRSLVLSLVTGALFGTSFSGSGEELIAAVRASQDGRYSREHEAAADAYALKLVAKRYGHVAGASRFFERLQKSELGGELGRVASYFSSHPLTADRLDALKAQAASSGFAQEGELTAVPDALRPARKDPAPGPAPTSPEPPPSDR